MPLNPPQPPAFKPTFFHVPPGPVAGPLQLLPINAAVVAVHRFRLQHVEIAFDEGFEQAMARAAQGRRNAAGDGASDALGIDLSW